MSLVSIHIPESLQSAVRQLAERDQISVDQFISLAIAEKVSALMTEDYLAERAAKGSREKFEAAMQKVADVEPSEEDRF